MSTNNPVAGEQVASDEPLGTLPAEDDDEVPAEARPEDGDDA
jgi:hypothetical protein